LKREKGRRKTKKIFPLVGRKKRPENTREKGGLFPLSKRGYTLSLWKRIGGKKRGLLLGFFAQKSQSSQPQKPRGTYRGKREKKKKKITDAGVFAQKRARGGKKRRDPNFLMQRKEKEDASPRPGGGSSTRSLTGEEKGSFMSPGPCGYSPIFLSHEVFQRYEKIRRGPAAKRWLR